MCLVNVIKSFIILIQFTISVILKTRVYYSIPAPFTGVAEENGRKSYKEVCLFVCVYCKKKPYVCLIF